MQIKRNLLIFVYFLLTAYLLINTPLVGDEFIWLNSIKDVRGLELLAPRGWFIVAPVEHYLLFIWVKFFTLTSLFLVNLLKITYVCLALYLITKFFTIFLDRQDALLASFLFVFFPTHDSTVFSYVGLYSTLTISFYLFAFYLAYKNRLFFAFLMALAASFTSYASVPIAFALFIFFILNKNFKKALIILLPNVFFCFYYFFISKIMHLTKSQLPDKIVISDLARQFLLQFLTFIDATLGPSMWLKVYYAFRQLSMPSVIIGIIFTAILYRITPLGKKKYDLRLISSLVVLAITSFFLFALTGWYPQMAFNLGNRTTLYGSLLLAYLIVLMPLPKILRLALFSLIVFSILGISDHWKNWGPHQGEVIENIKNNPDLIDYKDDKVIYVSGNQYSKYGPFSHIEFLSEDWVPNAIFKLMLNRRIPAKTINKRHRYADGYLVDTKYNQKIKINDYIVVYDSENDILFKLKTEEINPYIDSLPQEQRHWIQVLRTKSINDLLIRLSPRLKYAF